MMKPMPGTYYPAASSAIYELYGDSIACEIVKFAGEMAHIRINIDDMPLTAICKSNQVKVGAE